MSQSLTPYMFKNKKILSFKFPKQITTLHPYVFEYSRVYCDLIIPSTISRLYPYAFKDMGGICKIILSNSLTEIESFIGYQIPVTKISEEKLSEILPPTKTKHHKKLSYSSKNKKNSKNKNRSSQGNLR